MLKSSTLSLIERNNFRSNVVVVKIHHKYEKQRKLQNINKKKEHKK
jgi:hypothetical protein